MAAFADMFSSADWISQQTLIVSDSVVSQQMKEIVEKLKSLQRQYEDADAQGRYDRKAVETVYYQKLNEIERNLEYSEAISSKKSSILSFIRTGDTSHAPSASTIKKQIVDLLQLLKEVNNNIIKDETPSGEAGNIQESDRVDYYFDSFVGFEDQIQALQKKILSSGTEENASLIWIRGDSGSGKTRLAREVYNKHEIRAHFDGYAWVRVTRTFSSRKILEEIYRQLVSPRMKGNDNALEINDIELSHKLYELQQAKKCLVVLDDASIEALKSIRIAFPFEKDDQKSKVLVTTTSKGVENNKVAEKEVNLTMETLKVEEAWELLRKICGDGLKISKEHFEEKANKVESLLPLNILLLGGILKWRKWEDISPSIRLGNAEDMLNRSYEVLPFHLRPCFLYLGTFPESLKVETRTLYALWIAEGLIQPSVASEKKMNAAERYLHELVLRNLVQIDVEETTDIGRIRCCWLHNIQVRDFCRKKAEQEKYFGIMKIPCGDKPGPAVQRRLAIHVSEFEDGANTLFGGIDTQKCRSTLFFDVNRYEHGVVCPQKIADEKEFKDLRILHFDGLDMYRVMTSHKSRDKLVFLRYLGFKACILDQLTPATGTFHLLETLDLRVRRRCMVMIPNVLNKNIHLKYLYLPSKFHTTGKDNTEKLKLDNLSKLEIIENFDTSVCDADDLQKFPQLQRLSAIIDGDVKEAIDKIITYTKKEITHLQQVCIDIRNFDCYSEGRFTDLKTLLAWSVLTTFATQGYIKSFDLHNTLSGKLTEIALESSEVDDKLMEVLGKLPKLRILILCDDAYVGHEMVCSENEFPQLRILKLLNLPKLKNWEVKEGSMPNLSVLTIDKCRSLEKIPENIMKTLRDLSIFGMPPGFNIAPKDRPRSVVIEQ